MGNNHSNKASPNAQQPPFALVNETEDEFYDGIPIMPKSLFQKSKSSRSTQAAVSRVAGVSSRIGKAGIGKAVDVLDALGSSMTGLSSTNGFGSGTANKGDELKILAFEVANTIVKGSLLMQSLSKQNITQLKEVVLPSEGMQQLVSEDMDELFTIVAIDKRDELKIFMGEVVRFGNRSKASEWHNLDIYFEKRSRDENINEKLKEEAELIRQQLISLVQFTIELYHEMDILDKIEQSYQHKRLDSTRRELKGQMKIVKGLKKKCLWSKSLEEVMAKLVDIGSFLIQEMKEEFGDLGILEEETLKYQQRLGPSGLALHYANIVLQIDAIVARSYSVPATLRHVLYESLPPKMKSSFRSKLKSFQVKEDLTVSEIKSEMEKTLHWLVPIAINTAKAHHGFGWVGEWASTGSVGNRTVSMNEVIRIETFHYANKENTEACIVDLLVWLNHLITTSKSIAAKDRQ
ncbi:protein PSK SIMULATOR 1-like [Impatiens glandulifera]|uniref:protein PSK SIMULATOR 1-like n=1 Tax=Impatiens glandulifera TaxID=253017 RepID=UPI001FB13D4E|nr:protein PSK SIMULATOR 1-like [Impatiens glandulifera]